MKIKIYSDHRYLPEEVQHEGILSPFWGTPVEKNLGSRESAWTKRYNRYAQIGHSYFEMTSLSQADIAIAPLNWIAVRGLTWRTIKRHDVAKNLTIEFARQAAAAGKPTVVFFAGDCSDEAIPIKNAIVFRESLYRSRKNSNDFAVAAVNEDFVEQYLGGELIIRQKSKKPVVGFCGYAKNTPFLQAQIKSFFYQAVKLGIDGKLGVPPYQGHTLRHQVLQILSRSSPIEANFIERSGQVYLKAGSENINFKQQVRQEYLQNIIDSDYIFCSRGAGNFSFRFYETLCCGRIPVFLDTDCVLPYEFAIDWQKYCVWVDRSELPYIAEKIADFHHSLSPQEFVDLQYECRKLWQEWLSPEGFFANFYRHFTKQPEHALA